MKSLYSINALLLNNRFFVAGCFLLNAYSAISLLCLLLLLYMGDALFDYIAVHFFVTLLILVFSLFWRSTYFRYELNELESVAVVYRWTMRVLVITFILYLLLYLLFAALLLLVSGPQDY
ncbi:MAG TPA: hypothetical protein VL092_03675 [Chitinophagaceae bacterium]|nr:hypothetical protein [Chitinophagaceae bacterium]